MKTKSTVKKITDAAMLLLLPVLAAEIQLGQESHEWLGIAMLFLFVLHHVMNYKWFTGMFKGEYSPVRAFVTALNLLLFLDFLALAYSGPRMSGFALRGLKLPGSMRTARTLHLFASEWSFLLMAVHTGVHSGLHSKTKKNKKIKQNKTAEAKTGVKAEEEADGETEKGISGWFLCGLLFAISIFGMYSFWDLKMQDYLFLQTHFIFFDETKSLFFYLAEVVCMIVLFIVIGHCLTLFLKKWRLEKMGKRIAKIVAFLVPVIVCLVVIFALNHGNKGKHNAWGNAGTGWENGETTQNTPNFDATPGQNPDTGSVQAPGTIGSTQKTEGEGEGKGDAGQMQQIEENTVFTVADVQDGLLFVKGGTFSMGSPEGENWRGEDETLHTVTVSDFYMSAYELTQKEYEEIMGSSGITVGENHPHAQ